MRRAFEVAETKYLCIDKPANLLTEPAVRRSRLLGLDVSLQQAAHAQQRSYSIHA